MSAENKRCVVSFANGNGNYLKALARLGESLRHNFDGDFLGFIGERSIGAPSHSDTPYAFKLYAIKKALDAGYQQILWLDSSCFAVAPLHPVFTDMAKNGIICQDAGHLLGTWTNDATLGYFGLTRDEAMKISMIGNAGFLGLDFSNPIAHVFLDRWWASIPYFKGAWTNSDLSESSDPRCQGHRHDMSCSSAILHNMGLSKLRKPGDQWLQYAGPYDATLNNTILIKAQGI
jgi:hypothetical protein